MSEGSAGGPATGQAISAGTAGLSVPLQSWEASAWIPSGLWTPLVTAFLLVFSLFGQPHLDRGGGACPGLPGSLQTLLHSEIITFRKRGKHFFPYLCVQTVIRCT